MATKGADEAVGTAGELIDTVCICGSTQAEPFDESDGFQIGRCKNCGHIRTLQRAPDYETLYTEGDRYHSREMKRIGRDDYTDRFAHDFGIAADGRLPFLLKSFRLLDVGCANGAYVAAARELGINAEGLELNPGMAAWAADTTGALIHTSWDSVIPWFDAVVFNDVLEHVVDVNAELQRVRRHLKPAGLLIVDQPDAAEVFGPNARAPHHKKSAQHLHYFTEQVFSNLLERNGFIVEEIDRPLPGKLVHRAIKTWA